ncbi:MAG: hypothetical protein LBE49_01160 [Deltaproteobacteria bacterium]|jgi:hypothetical protein|nr:hypothetical protein [Deltaproteobacteria bacterium]
MLAVRIISVLAGIVLIVLMLMYACGFWKNGDKEESSEESRGGPGPEIPSGADGQAGPAASSESLVPALTRAEPLSSPHLELVKSPESDWAPTLPSVDEANRESSDKRRQTVVVGTCFSGLIGRR